jgi:hypothetical protein
MSRCENNTCGNCLQVRYVKGDKGKKGKNGNTGPQGNTGP